jgi:gamma-glutamylcyclotransferase (GGCT)/AIG2-like uncharacterized protein YtfP
MTDSGNSKLFVYGSLRSGFRSPAYEYISRYFTLLGEGKVKGRLYDMGDYPAAIPSTDEAFIVGELYGINNPRELSWAFSQLDDYEGVLVESHERPLYRRELAGIISGEGIVEAWIYWFNGDVSGKPAIDCGDILEYMRTKKDAI